MREVAPSEKERLTLGNDVPSPVQRLPKEVRERGDPKVGEQGGVLGEGRRKLGRKISGSRVPAPLPRPNILT